MAIDLSTEAGQVTYRRSVTFLLMKTVHEMLPEAQVIDRFSIHKALYFELQNAGAVDKELVERIKSKMKDLVAEKLPIIYKEVPKDEAIKIIEKHNMTYRLELFKQANFQKATFYQCGDYFDMLCGKLLDSTEGLDQFELDYYGDGMVLRTPMTEKGVCKIHELIGLPKLTSIRKETKKWAKILNCDYVADLNKLVGTDGFGDMVRVSEGLHEKKIAQIADHIADNIENLRVITIAGPSSSGKTSFAQRLRIQLRVNGIEPISLSLDDYYVNRVDTPLDEKGEYDFEALEAIDIKLFNEHLVKLMAGEEVKTPIYNFLTGQREWSDNPPKKIRPDQPIIIEGIHGLNEKLTSSVPRENKYKIYISALTPLSLDRHNRIPTTQARLLRRLVRDYKTRGFSGSATLHKWASVRAGEEKNIFPYQEEADIMFNSALIYELSLLKKYAVPMLNEISQDDPQYQKAQELLDFCSCFRGEVDESDVPNNSILREFIGGSVFFK